MTQHLASARTSSHLLAQLMVNALYNVPNIPDELKVKELSIPSTASEHTVEVCGILLPAAGWEGCVSCGLIRPQIRVFSLRWSGHDRLIRAESPGSDPGCGWVVTV